jgi:hypothetical protein
MLIIDEEKSLDRVSELLALYDIPVKDSEDNYRNMSDVLDDISDIWDGLNKKEQGFFSIIFSSSFPVYVQTSAKKIGNAMRSVLEKISK